MHKLKQTGFIRSFLSDRKIISKVGSSYSTSRLINLGISQGSIISPVLFNLLIHNLPKHIGTRTYVAQYADDVAIWIKVKLRSKTIYMR